MTIMQTAWLIYGVCGLGFCLATWWLFLWAWRFVRYSAVVTVMTLLFTPYAIDAQTMQMAPAIFTLIFNGVALGLDAILPLIKLMAGIWLIGVILMGVYVLLTRNAGHHYREPAPVQVAHSRAANSRNSARSSPSRAAARNSNARYSDSHSPAPANKKKSKQKPPSAPRKEYFPMDNLSREERQARDEMLHGELPMRAIRD